MGSGRFREAGVQFDHIWWVLNCVRKAESGHIRKFRGVLFIRSGYFQVICEKGYPVIFSWFQAISDRVILFGAFWTASEIRGRSPSYIW